MTIYEMTEQARYLYDLLESGEIDAQTFADSLESIGADEKCDSYCRIIRQLQADVEALKAEKERLDAKKKTAENAIERMKGALLAFTQASGGKVKTSLFSVGTRTSQKTEILDPDAIPAVYKVPQPDKIATAEILKALKEGETIPGAALAESVSVVIK
jgi:hypothetical protein